MLLLTTLTFSMYGLLTKQTNFFSKIYQHQHNLEKFNSLERIMFVIGSGRAK